MTEKRAPAAAGETVAFAKLDRAKTGDTLSAGKQPHKPVAEVAPYAPVLAIAISAKDRKDDVKLGVSFNKLLDEDPSLVVHHNPETHEVVVWGQGEMHLRVATERLATLASHGGAQASATARPSASDQRRRAPQAAGGGPVGSVTGADIAAAAARLRPPCSEKIVGSAVPRNYVPSVRRRVTSAPLARAAPAPVVDLAVCRGRIMPLPGHSSDMAPSRQPHRPPAAPAQYVVLLDHDHTVRIVCPTRPHQINAAPSGGATV